MVCGSLGKFSPSSKQKAGHKVQSEKEVWQTLPSLASVTIPLTQAAGTHRASMWCVMKRMPPVFAPVNYMSRPNAFFLLRLSLSR